MTNIELAKEAVEKLGVFTLIEDAPAKAWIFRLDALGYGTVLSDSKVEDKEAGPVPKDLSEKDARKKAVDIILKDLEDGNIVLSDNWVKENL